MRAPAAGGAAPSSAAVPAALVAVLLLQVVGSLAGSNWLWGLETLRFWSAPAAVALVLLGVAGFVPAIARWLEPVLERLGRALDRGGWRPDLAVGLASGLLLFALRDPLRFVGDSSLRLQTLYHPLAPTTLFPQAAPLDLLLGFHLPRALAGLGVPHAVALQAVGAAVGAGFAIVGFRLLRALGATGAALSGGLLVALSGAHFVHFAGYDKFGPSMLGIALAALGAVETAAGRRGAWWLACGAAVAVLSHRSGLLVLPSIGWIAWRAWRSEPNPRERSHLAWAAIVPAAALAVSLPRVLQTLATLDLRVHLPSGAVERSLQSPDAPALLMRAADFANGLLHAAPLCPAGLVAAFAMRGRGSGRFGLAGPLALVLGIQAAVLIAVGATRGSGRDWDVLCAAGSLASLATAGVLARLWIWVPWTAAPGGARGGARLHRSNPAPVAAVSVALAIDVALWGIHANEAMGLRRAAALLSSRPAWSATSRAHAHDFLGLRAFSLGRYDDAERQFERAIAAAPNPRYFLQLGTSRLAGGSPGRAIEPLRRATTLSPTMPEGWLALAAATVAIGDSAGARAVLDSARTIVPGDPRIATQRLRLDVAGRMSTGARAPVR